MAGDTLLAALGRDADAEAAAILARADADAAAVRAGAEARVAAVRDARVAARRAELAAATERAGGAARREARQQLLAARWRFVQRVLDRAGAMLPAALEGAAGADVLRGLLVEAEAYLPPGRAVVRCAPSASDALRAAPKGSVEREIVPDPAVTAGLLAEAGDGSVVVDNTLEARLARLGRALAAELVRREGAGA